MIHSFNTEIAEKYGIREAVLINHISFWLEKNMVNEKNIIDGRPWTYNSVKAFQKQFPYLSEKQIRSTLERLVAKGVLEKGTHNKVAWDRTSWYTFTEEFAESELCPIRHFPKRSSLIPPNREIRSAQKGEPIPDTRTDNKTDNRKEYLPLAYLLITRIRENEPQYFGRKDTDAIAYRWARDIRLLIERDGRDREHVQQVIIWAQDNDFWKRNILSGKKLREKFGTLLMQMAKDRPKKKKESMYVDETDPYFSEEDLVEEIPF
jgi:hypothetical protein